MKLAALALVTTLLAAGCLTRDEMPTATPGADENDVSVSTSEGLHVDHHTGTLTASAGLPAGYLLPSEPYEVDVPPDATALVIELLWADAREDLDLIMHTPKEERIMLDGGSVGSGDAPLRLVLSGDDLQEGTYLFRVAAKAAVAEEFHLYLSVFEGIMPAEDWTATTADGA